MKAIACATCGIFKNEWALLPTGLRARFAPFFLDSMLHMKPLALEAELMRASVEAGGAPLVLCYGECCASIDSIASRPGRARTKGRNCVEIVLGEERYKEGQRAGAFFFMPEWVERWKEVFIGEFGLSPGPVARSFFSENASRFFYVDTGLGTPPPGLLSEIGDYVGASIGILRAGIEGLAAALETALEAIGHRMCDP